MQGHRRSWYVVGKGRASAVERASIGLRESEKINTTMEVATFMDESVNESITLMENLLF